MNSQIARLSDISKKNEKYIIGLMSGTSLDGLDVALCKVSGADFTTNVELIHFDTVSYSQEVKQRIQNVFSKPKVDFLALCTLDTYIATLHAKTISKCLDKWNIPTSKVDLIASHGQTVFHAPKHFHHLSGETHVTCQIGDGDHIANHTQIITLSDFRQKHIAHGGEGAPLAVYGDYLLFHSNKTNRCLINIGGISNMTYLPSVRNFSAVHSSDLGPGNTLMDNFVMQYFGRPFDDMGKLAEEGTLNRKLLNACMNDQFFKEPYPKSTGPEHFNLTWFENILNTHSMKQIDKLDQLATLNHLTALSISNGIKKFLAPHVPIEIYVSGGGYKNRQLLHNLNHYLGVNINGTTDCLHVNPDAKEAILFAVLANQTISGNMSVFSKEKDVDKHLVFKSSATSNGISFGKISLPN